MLDFRRISQNGGGWEDEVSFEKRCGFSGKPRVYFWVCMGKTSQLLDIQLWGKYHVRKWYRLTSIKRCFF